MRRVRRVVWAVAAHLLVYKYNTALRLCPGSSLLAGAYHYSIAYSTTPRFSESFPTAKSTLDGMEAMRMIQKGQIHHVGKDVVKQPTLKII